ncbi:hypothetical protein K402DRAFT_339478 [Aulographum hederae CBS 113979]|uniref:Anaphase-promoting complex subunit 5 n=1 Tax=Aulographum hederae CBS 113979 TaxID=1176131 RepID=A0A6G1GPZ4_9PEZI|nr:hypothetical protein K402DRAFT_339478 [Aulographum hederae CBS 113979]
MSRYLTPSKLCLLVLTSLYTESVVPDTSIIPILSFIIANISPCSGFIGRKATSQKPLTKFRLTIQDFENVTITHPSHKPGRTLFDLFLERIWSINSLSALHQLFDDLRDILAKTRDEAQADADAGILPPEDKIILARSSPLGVFVRRARVEFMRMVFGDVSKLWMDFVKYKQPTLMLYQRRNPSAGPSFHDINIEALGLKEGDELLDILAKFESDEECASSHDVERILEFQVERLQRLGNRIPDAMKRELEQMLLPATPVPSLNEFINFFDSWRAGDYNKAFDSLHRYFDMTMQSQNRTYYQYALLHLAILHADFGAFKEAFLAMKETIITARENQDHSCLYFSMSWINHLHKAYPTRLSQFGFSAPPEGKILSFLETKAEETHMWSLLSSTYLAHAKFGLSKGGKPAVAVEVMDAAADVILTRDIDMNQATYFVMNSALFSRLGMFNHNLADCYNELIMDNYRDFSPVEEVLRATCRLAHASTNRGAHKTAQTHLSRAPASAHTTLRFYQYLTAHTSLLQLRRALTSSSLPHSTALLTHLTPLLQTADPDLTHEAHLLRAHLAIRTRTFAAAIKLLDPAPLLPLTTAGSDAKKRQKHHPVINDVAKRVQFMLMRARYHMATSEPQRAEIWALRALREAGFARILPCVWEAVEVLCAAYVRQGGVWNGMARCVAARKILEAAIPAALEGCDMALVGRMYEGLGDAWMGEVGEVRRMGRGMEKEGWRGVGMADLFLGRAGDYFSTISAHREREPILQKRALIARLRGDEKLAERYVDEALALRKRIAAESREGGCG